MELVVTEVPCCVCRETGKVTRLVFFSKDCPVCEGVGQRKVIYDARFTPEERDMVLRSARYGVNLGPRRFDQNFFGFGLF